MSRLLTTLIVLACLPAVTRAHDLYGVDLDPRVLEHLHGGQSLAAFPMGPARFGVGDRVAYSQARTAALARQLATYTPVNQFGTGNALVVSEEQLRLALYREEMSRRSGAPAASAWQARVGRARHVTAYVPSSSVGGHHRMRAAR